jgi:hypothetical protein
MVRKYVETVEAYCELIEGHRRVGISRFLVECAALLSDLCGGTMRLPKAKGDDDISDRRHKIFRAINPDPGTVMRTMMEKTGRKGPSPNLWDPIVRKWMRAARSDPARIALVRDDPYFDTEIPSDAWHDLYESLSEYLGGRNTYWIVFCPYHRDEGIRCSLADDLADVWRDVKEGLLVFRKGPLAAREHAIWMWRFGYHTHWAQHAAMALNPLTWLVSEAYTNARNP